MADFDELRAAARRAREAGVLEEAIKLGRQVWEGATDRGGWDAWLLAFALRKSGRAPEAMRIAWDGLQLLRGDERATGSLGERLASELGWAAYNAEMKNVSHPQPARIAKVAATVVEAWDEFTMSSPWTREYCPVPLVVSRAIKLLKEAEAWTFVAHLASITDGDRMPDEPLRPGEGDQRGDEWTRPEAWYVAAAHAFVEENRYDVVLALLSKAEARHVPLGRHALQWLHFNGAKAAIGARDGCFALSLLEKARSEGVNDWWLSIFSAQAAELDGDQRAAIQSLAEAFVAAENRRVPPEFLCTALDTAARVVAPHDAVFALRCARVHRGIREAHSWRIPEALDVASGGTSEAPSSLPQLFAYWRELYRRLQDRHQGVVTKVLNEGSGFIRDDDGSSRYFGYPRGVMRPTWCVEGARVSFRPVQRRDRKDGIDKPAADEVALVARA